MILVKFRKGVTYAVVASGLLFCSQPILASADSGDTLKLTMEKALELAINENLNIKIADAEIERVDYLKKENQFALLPSVNANAQYTNNILKPVFFSDFFPGGKMAVGSTNSYAVSGTMQLPLFSLAMYKNIQLSEIELKSALESARSTKIDLVLQVKNTFFGIIMMKESYKVLNQSYNNAIESAINIKNMFERGMASEYDKIRSEVAARNITPTLTQTQNALELAKMQLKILLSLNLDIPIDVEGDLSGYESEISNFKEGALLDLSSNSGLKSMDIQLERMNKNIELIQSQRLPSLSGFMNYQLQMQNQEFAFNKPWSNSLSAGFVIQVPIFNKLSITLKHKQAKIGLKQVEFQKTLLKENMTLAAQNAINQMQRAKVQLESDKEAVKQAQKGYEIAKVRYTTGTGTVLELNDTEVALTRSRLNLNQTIYDFLKAKNDFEKVIGKENINR